MSAPSVLQSPNDSRQLRSITLNNGLRVLLVQQVGTEKSAAALTVNIGHFDDPIEREGLAHFLEHMLFLGTQKFPTPGEFAHFINHHGGNFNAWTGTECSSFFFDIEPHSYTKGLERFADMFIAPLFHPDYIEKERQSIEAEFLLKLKEDGRRISQVHKETVNPAHPFSKFSVGNQTTLQDREHESLKQAVEQFFHSNYSTSRMTLCLVSAQPLDELEAIATRYFCALPNHLGPKDALQAPLYLLEQQQVFISIKPHKHNQLLIASFALPDIQSLYKYKLISFLAHLLGDEGPGSLLAQLKQRGLVNQLSAGGGVDGSNFKDFNVSFELTDLGVEYYETILHVLFGQLHLLGQQEFPVDLFIERQRLVNWSFLYQEQSSAQQTACDLSVNMHHYPLQDYLYGDYRMDLPTDTLWRQLLDYFVPTNLRVLLIAPKVSTQQKARWYKTPYQVEKLPPKLLDALLEAKPTQEARLPSANPYLVDELTLLPEHEHQEKPVLVCNQHSLRLWLKKDTEFRTPKGHIYVQLNLPRSIASVVAMAKTRLWLELFQDSIAEHLYAATTAGLTYNIHVQNSGLSLHCAGLAGHQIRLVADLLSQLITCQFSEERFAEIRGKLVKHWQNHKKNKPVTKLFSQLSSLLQPLNPNYEQLAQELGRVTFESFLNFHQQFLQQLSIESLMIGNWTTGHAKELEGVLYDFKANLLTGDFPSKQSFSTKGLGPNWLTFPQQSSENALVIYLPAQQKTAKAMALFMLANHLLSPQYFHHLRTEQQLGYLVGTGYVPINLLPGIAFYIQSPSTQSAELYDATVTFYKAFLSELEQLSAEQFTQRKKGLLSQISERDANLAARAKRLWLALSQNDHQFILQDELSEALTNLELSEFVSFFYQLLHPDYDVLALATNAPSQSCHLKVQNASKWRQQLALVKE